MQICDQKIKINFLEHSHFFSVEKIFTGTTDMLLPTSQEVLVLDNQKTASAIIKGT